MTEPVEPTQSPFVPHSPALAAAYIAAMARLRASMAAFVARQFHHSGTWHAVDARAFASIVPSVVAGAQRAVSTVTAAYLHQLTAEMTGTTRPPVGVPASEVTGSAVRNGVDPREVYRRPYTQVWTDLAAGTPLDDAVNNGERRALHLVSTDLQLAKIHTAHQVMLADERVVGWRRVPQGTYTCALCLIASTRRYRKEELAAMHPGCDCTVEPIVGDFDPGPILDEDFLQAVHDAVKRDLGREYVAPSGKKDSTRARELHYRDIIVVNQHGELGDVLGVRGHHFTGPDGVERLSHKRIE